MDFSQFISWAFQTLLAGSVVYAASKIGKMQESIEHLAKEVAVLTNDNAWIKDSIKELKKQPRGKDGKFAKKRPKFKID